MPTIAEQLDAALAGPSLGEQLTQALATRPSPRALTTRTDEHERRSRMLYAMSGARADDWVSGITGIGHTSFDKRTTAVYQFEFVTDIEAQNLWRGDDLAAKIIELPARTMLRAGFQVKIQDDKETSEAIQQRLKILKVKSTYVKAKMFERAYGGAAIFPAINDGQDLEMPLNEERISSIDHLNVYEPQEIAPNTYYLNDPRNPKAGQPETWTLNPIRSAGSRVVIHESRLIIFPGIRVSNDDGLYMRPGFGDSVLTRVSSVLRDYNISWASAAILLHDFSQAVFKMKGLMELFANDDDGTIASRMQALELSRSVARAVLIDSEEEFERKQTPLTGMPEMLSQFATRVAAAADIPVTLLMGTSPGGLNATGDSDVRFFYDQVVNKRVGDGMDDQLERIVSLEMKSQSSTGGLVAPDQWSVHHNPLWQESEGEKATSRKTQAESDAIYITNGVLTPEEVATSRFGGDDYSFETVVDFEERERLEAEEEKLEAEAIKAAALNPEPTPDDPAPPFPPEPEREDALHGHKRKRLDRIEKRGREWVVLSEDGKKVLGRHSTPEKAVAQLRAIEASKGE